MKHRGVVRNGKFMPNNRKLHDVSLELMEGKTVEVEYRSVGRATVGNLDGFYFKYLVKEVAARLEDFSDCYSPIEVHEKLMVAITGSYEVLGKDLIVKRDSYSKMTHEEKVCYINRVKTWLEVEYQIIIEDGYSSSIEEAAKSH